MKYCEEDVGLEHFPYVKVIFIFQQSSVLPWPPSLLTLM